MKKNLGDSPSVNTGLVTDYWLAGWPTGKLRKSFKEAMNGPKMGVT
ncbi:MAG: hypothetical protein LBS44_02920 [Deltaproteobacteria bacterium]|nr:hypothetical protein [Deltaproteobacteria bacterium]